MRCEASWWRWNEVQDLCWLFSAEVIISNIASLEITKQMVLPDLKSETRSTNVVLHRLVFVWTIWRKLIALIYLLCAVVIIVKGLFTIAISRRGSIHTCDFWVRNFIALRSLSELYPVGCLCNICNTYNYFSLASQKCCIVLQIFTFLNEWAQLRLMINLNENKGQNCLN